jgi:hypothetical protein
VENLQGRVALIERRLQLISEELSFARSYPARNGLPATADASTTQSANLEGGSRDVDGVVPFPAQVHIDADSVSAFAHGFFGREYDSNGLMFRWTGNGPLCELRFFIDRSVDRQFRLSVGDSGTDVLGPISGFVDYASIPLSIDQTGNGNVLVGTVPKRSTTRLAVASFLLGEAPAKQTSESPGTDAPTWLGFKFYAFDAS